MCSGAASPSGVGSTVGEGPARSSRLHRHSLPETEIEPGNGKGKTWGTKTWVMALKEATSAENEVEIELVFASQTWPRSRPSGWRWAR